MRHRAGTRLATTATTLCLLALGAELDAQDLFSKVRNPKPLIADTTASAVGDILTVVIAETHKVKNEDKVDRKMESDLAARLEAYTLGSDLLKTNVLPKVDIRTESGMKGEAKQEKDSKFDAQVAVVVVDVHPNGNLVVAGTRVIVIDDETKTLRISGLVRPLDISQANTVPSSKVADARVSLISEGGNARQVTKGPVGTLFETLVWAVWPF